MIRDKRKKGVPDGLVCNLIAGDRLMSEELPYGHSSAALLRMVLAWSLTNLAVRLGVRCGPRVRLRVRKYADVSFRIGG